MPIEDPLKISSLPIEDQRLFLKTIEIYRNPTFAEMYFSKWGNDLPISHLETFSKLVGVSGIILDAGCGPGHHSNFLSGLGHSVIGIDLSLEALKLAKANFAAPFFIQANMLSMPFRDDTFSGIWACASLMHLPKPLLGLQLTELGRTLKDDGIVSLTLTVEKEPHLDSFGRFFESYQRGYLIEQITRNGFSLVALSDRVRERTTEQENQVAGWVTITARKSNGGKP